MGQGPSVLADDSDISHDDVGFTHPNLHRRIYTPPDATDNKTYKIGIFGVDSYRTTETYIHDEESTTSEVP